jgi:hypothetical protein
VCSPRKYDPGDLVVLEDSGEVDECGIVIWNEVEDE